MHGWEITEENNGTLPRRIVWHFWIANCLFEEISLWHQKVLELKFDKLEGFYSLSKKKRKKKAIGKQKKCLLGKQYHGFFHTLDENLKNQFTKNVLLFLWIRNSADEKFFSLTSIFAAKPRSISADVLESSPSYVKGTWCPIFFDKIIFSCLMITPSVFSSLTLQQI